MDKDRVKRQKTQRWIEKQVEFFKPLLGLDSQKISVAFREDTGYMEITLTYPYLEPTIRFNDKVVKDLLGGDLKADRVLHELCHVLTDPLYTKACGRWVSKDEVNDERERLTDTMTIIIRNLIEKL